MGSVYSINGLGLLKGVAIFKEIAWVPENYPGFWRSPIWTISIIETIERNIKAPPEMRCVVPGKSLTPYYPAGIPPVINKPQKISDHLLILPRDFMITHS